MEKIASMACKVAVKANHVFSLEEATSLIKELVIRKPLSLSPWQTGNNIHEPV